MVKGGQWGCWIIHYHRLCNHQNNQTLARTPPRAITILEYIKNPHKVSQRIRIYFYTEISFLTLTGLSIEKIPVLFRDSKHISFWLGLSPMEPLYTM